MTTSTNAHRRQYAALRANWDQVWTLATTDHTAAMAHAATFATATDLEYLARALVNLNRRPEVGEDATYHIGSDRYPATVVSVSKSGHQCTVAVDGREPEVFTRRNVKVRMPVWAASTVAAGTRYLMRGCDFGSLTFGHADRYLDPSF